MSIPHEITLQEIEARIERMRAYMESHNLDGLCIFGAMRTFYLSGFHHLATERPVVLVLPLQGELALLVPHLEEENIPLRTPHIREIKVYREYPGRKHPMQYLGELLAEKGLVDKRLGVDSEGWGGGWGYRGPALAQVVPDVETVNVRDVIDDMRMVKSPEEIALVRYSAHFGNVAHAFLQEFTEVGLSELEIGMRASADATAYMLRALGPEWEPGGSMAGAGAAFTSGWKTALNHRRAGARKVQVGDVLLSYAGSDVGGYVSELERMMIVGEPTAEHEKYFELEVEAQDIAFDAIKSGARCCDVEKAVDEFLHQHDLHSLTRTHIGHGIGTEGHEAPFLDVGDETEIKPGMMLTVEPCLFVPGFAGFRHSDTVLVTESGIDMITYYPRDLESLVIPV